MSTIAVAPRHDTARGVARGLGAFLALAALVAGVPWLLATLAGWPLPTAVPSLSEIGDALADRFVPEGVLVKGLALACWILWFQLAVCLLVEAVAVIGRRRAPDLPLAGPVQKLAARLVAAVALFIALAATRESAAQRPLPPPPVSVAAVLPGAGGPALTPVAAVTEGPAPAVHVVQPRDTLWGIAEERLGDPFRWRELFELNRERPQPDGRSLRQPELIHPGWRIVLPADAAPVAAATVTVTRPPDGPATMTDESDAGEAMVDLGPGGATEQAGRR